MDRSLIVRYAIRETMGIIIMGVALFWSAGRLDWWPAWAALVVMGAWIVATAIVIIRFHPDLLRERLGPRKGARPWDLAIVSLLGILQLVRYIIAGLDQRYGWTGDWPLGVQSIALVLCALGYAVFIWATAANPFFSQVFRIQSERGHTVVASGPYRNLRHPAYFGAILYELAVPVLLGSVWALGLSVLTAALLVVRTSFEDQALQAELPGYIGYARQVRYRLLPRIW